MPRPYSWSTSSLTPSTATTGPAPSEELAARRQRVHRGWLAGDILPDDVDELRSFLFFWFRADRHGGGYGPSEEDLVWLTALLDALRRALPIDSA
jgi:hypothetical protein